MPSSAGTVSLDRVPLMVTVEPVLSFFSLAYAASATATFASVSLLVNERPLVIFERSAGREPVR